METGRGSFALDIGTRTVVGLVVDLKGEEYTVLAQETMEHSSRVMYDGQIHDIEAVATCVKCLKKKLEEQLGTELKRASVAAAGRSLVTVSATAKKNISTFVEVTEEDIKGLETEALSKAAKILSEQEKGKAFDDYYLVGFSPVKYFLDDVRLTSLLGQKGGSIFIEIVATFLPRSVVDSLMSVLSRCGLSLESITLEPIAASYVAIPSGMRKLNIALVDIGAGTSDIAISTDGSIFAYGMVPLAGDEITEKICEAYLLDFYVAEGLKRDLGCKDLVEFCDILGTHHSLTSEEILTSIMPYIIKIAGDIADKIVKINGQVPAAVLLIGGGSQLPGLGGALADELGLPRARVGVKGRESLNSITGADELKGPFSVTPLGIAVNALGGQTLSFFRVSVKGRDVHLLRQERPTLLDALVLAGIPSREIFGCPGKALTFTINGEFTVIPGKRGKPARVMLDNKSAQLDTSVYDRAAIDFVPGEDGQAAKGTIGDFILPEHKSTIIINGRDFQLNPHIEMNGKTALAEDEILENAQIVLRPRDLILSDIFTIISFKADSGMGKLVTKINGVDAGFASPVTSGDAVDIYWQS